MSARKDWVMLIICFVSGSAVPVTSLDYPHYRLDGAYKIKRICASSVTLKLLQYLEHFSFKM